MQSQEGQQNIWDAILKQYLGLSQDPSAQNADINFMMGSPTGQAGSTAGGGGLYGNLSNQMNAVAGTVPGSSGSVNPEIMNMVMGNFQQPEYQNASSLYYNALKNVLGVNVPTVGSQNQMQLGGQTASSFAGGVGNGMGQAAGAPGNQPSTAADYQLYNTSIPALQT